MKPTASTKRTTQGVCGDCKYLGVTYQPHQPWSCTRFGFKSRELPARVVLRETGTECAYKTPRARRSPKP
ncbi:hypothetical protein DD557_13340 [Thalassobacter stenotrophicus]|nr:hypothetical protein DD557_13340 [Thalassobacter stenotrophicus]